MIEMFQFSLTEVATSLRFIIVLALLCWTILLVTGLSYRTARAVSYGRFLFKMGGKIAWWEVPKYILYCYSYTRISVTKTWSNGSYWQGVGDWRYFNEKSKKFVVGSRYK